MKNIDIKRTCSAMRWLVMTNLHSLIRQTTILGIVILTFTIGSSGGFRTGLTYEVMSDGVYRAAGVFIPLMGLFLITAASLITTDMKGTQARINTLMLPASNLEKFVTRYLYVTVVSFVSFFVAFLAADLLQMLFRLVQGNPVVSLFGIFTPDIDLNVLVNDRCWAVSLVISVSLFVHSIYILGGTFFRRNQWILTTITCIVLALVVSWLAVTLAFSFSFGLLDGGSHFINLFGGEYVVDAYSLIIAADVALLLLVALNYFLSYRLFCRMQVINNKWVNL